MTQFNVYEEHNFHKHKNRVITVTTLLVLPLISEDNKQDLLETSNPETVHPLPFWWLWIQHIVAIRKNC